MSVWLDRYRHVTIRADSRDVRASNKAQKRTMIAYQDFAPQILQTSGIFKNAIYETFDDAVAAANAWIESQSVRVVNVETVVLPNMWLEEGTTDVELKAYGGSMSSHWHQFIRVWYEAS